MNAFEFGWRMHKVAASVPDNNAPGGDPDFNALRARYAKANLPAAAWEHAGLPAMTAEQLQNASASDIWHINQRLAAAPQASFNRNTAPSQVRSFNSARTFATNMGKRYNPVFATPGKPGYKPPLASITGATPAPVNPAAPPAAPAAAPPAAAAPAAPPARPAMPAWQPGQAVPAGHVVNDRNELMAKDPSLTRIETAPPPAIPRTPVQRPVAAAAPRPPR